MVRRGGNAILAAGLLLTGCAHFQPATHPRPALPLPDHIAARYALDGEVFEESLVEVGNEPAYRVFRGRVRAGEEIADFHALIPHGKGAKPFVLCLPILAGGEALMWMVGGNLVERGYAVAWTKRVASALKPGQRGPELEELFRGTVRHNRMVLEWAREQPQIDSSRMGCVGISMGGMVASALMAVEPDLQGGAVCLAGGNLADMLMVSAEPRAERWRRWRHVEDGISGSMLRAELREHIVSDPALLGPFIPTEKVVLIGGALDSVVPPNHLDLLWESLGRPERHTLPLGHYTAALAFPSIMTTVDGFLGQRLSRPPGLAKPE